MRRASLRFLRHNYGQAAFCAANDCLPKGFANKLVLIFFAGKRMGTSLPEQEDHRLRRRVWLAVLAGCGLFWIGLIWLLCY